MFAQNKSKWEQVRLETILTQISNGITAEQIKDGGGIPVTRIETIAGDRIDASRTGFIRNVSPAEIDKFRLQAGDILISHINSESQIGRSVVYTGKPDFLLHGMNLLRLKVDRSKVVPEFLNYELGYYRSIGKFIAIASRAVGQSSINQGKLKSLIVSVAPLSEQVAIVRILGAIDKSIDLRKRELQLERERKAALMQHLFTYGTRDELRKHTEIGEIPDGWSVLRLGVLCDIRYGLGQPPELDEDGVPMIRATDIKGGKIVSQTVIRAHKGAIPKRKNAFLTKGDIIVVRSGAYTGDLSVYDGRWETAVAGYDLVASPTNSEIDSEYLAFYLLSNDSQRYFRSQRDRSAQPHLNADQLRNAVVVIPPLAEQLEIASVLNACERKIAILDQECRLLNELFRAMLEELMTGRLSVTPLIDAEA